MIRGKGSNRVTDQIAKLRDLAQQGDNIRNELLVSLFKSKAMVALASSPPNGPRPQRA